MGAQERGENRCEDSALSQAPAGAMIHFTGEETGSGAYGHRGRGRGSRLPKTSSLTFVSLKSFPKFTPPRPDSREGDPGLV